MATSKRKPRYVVVAIDIGTTYSGYAFSFHSKPLDIMIHPGWISGTTQLQSLKTSTCVLLTPNKEFDSFGYEAENKYADLTEQDQHHGWYFFRRFKMLLYNTQDVTADTVIADIADQELPALSIFRHAIRYLKDHCLEVINMRKTGLTEYDFQYVLTVPAIWGDKAKVFMRKAASQAGIQSGQLRMALEPEAASLWCQVIAKEENIDIGRKYTVIDLGGGTADITVNETSDDGTLVMLHKATGGAWGDRVNGDINERIVSSGLAGKCRVTADKLFVEKSIVQGWFKETVGSIINHLTMELAFEEHDDIKSILLVGGFAESKLVQEAIRDAFRDKTVITLPKDAGLAVLKGAVRFGHFPNLVAARKSRFSYGISCTVDFDPSVHRPEKKRTIDGRDVCPGVFDEVVAMNEDLNYGKSFIRELCPAKYQQDVEVISLYASEREGTRYVDAIDCRRIGDISVPFPTSGNRDDRRVRVYMSFWDTEIKFQVEVCKTGEGHAAQFFDLV